LICERRGECSARVHLEVGSHQFLKEGDHTHAPDWGNCRAIKVLADIKESAQSSNKATSSILNRHVSAVSSTEEKVVCEASVIEWSDNENHVTVVALHKTGKSAFEIFTTPKKLRVSRMFTGPSTGSLIVSLRPSRTTVRTRKLVKAVAARTWRNPVRKQSVIDCEIHGQYVRDLEPQKTSLGGLGIHLNSHHTQIQFTMETENDGQLPFWDVLVCRKKNGFLGHKVYWKPMHTNRYLHKDSPSPQTEAGDDENFVRPGQADFRSTTP
ncbi:hypothetical protein ANN_10993, partial [Periplaneta americana]